MILILNITSVLMATLAAGFWLISAMITIPSPEIKITTRHGVSPLSPESNKAVNDFFKTLQKQSKLSAYAAMCAGVSALCQVAVIVIQSYLVNRTS